MSVAHLTQLTEQARDGAVRAWAQVKRIRAVCISINPNGPYDASYGKTHWANYPLRQGLATQEDIQIGLMWEAALDDVTRTAKSFGKLYREISAKLQAMK